MTYSPIVVLADDLTGASDAAVPFARRGARTTVSLALEPARGDDVDVLAVDLDTRTLPTALARERVAAALRSLAPDTRVFKKIDSTLRGNIAAETEALLAARPDAVALVVPAHPAHGRTQRDGFVHLGDAPIADTAVGRDLFTPVASSDVRNHLPRDTTAVVAAPGVLGGVAALRTAVDAAIARGMRAIALDATTQADLAAIATLADASDRYLWIGSAGLFDAIADAFIAPRAYDVAWNVVRCERPVLFVIGSLSATTHAQIARFVESGGTTVAVDPRSVLIDEGRGRARVLARRIAEALATGGDVLVALSSDRLDVEAALAMGRAHGFDVATTSRELRERFVELVRDAVPAAGAIVLSGADVARSFCLATGIPTMRVVGETAAEVPLARATGTDALLVLKAGGAGSAETFLDIARRLRPRAPVER